MSCCCCPSTITVQLSNCGGAVSGASITITGAGGPYSGTTNAQGQFAQSIPAGDDGAFTVSYSNGGFSGSTTVKIPTGKCEKISVPFFYVNKTCVTVMGCSGELSGVSVSGNGASCTTDGTGKCCLTYTTNPPATITVSVTYLSRTQSTNLSGAAQCTAGFSYVDRNCFCVTTECCGFPIFGPAFPFGTFAANVTLTVNGHAAGGGTTDANGYLCLIPAYGTVPGDTIVVNLTATAHQPATVSWTLPATLAAACAGCASTASFNPCLGSNSSSNCITPAAPNTTTGSFIMVHDGSHDGAQGVQKTPFQRCPCDGIINRTVTVNDGIGPVTLTATSGCGTFVGCAMRPATNSCQFDNPPDPVFGNCPASAGGMVPVFFTWNGTNLCVGSPTCDPVGITPRHDLDCSLGSPGGSSSGICPAIYLDSCVPPSGTVTASTAPPFGLVTPLFYIYGATVTLVLSG
jgi:hypothetical protein